MKGKAFKILLIMAFMVVIFCAFSISSSANTNMIRQNATEPLL